MSELVRYPDPMSNYERKRWEELQTHWEKKAQGSTQILPPKARAALDTTVQTTRETASRAVRAVAERTPEKVKDAAGMAVDAALVPTVHNVVQLLELLNGLTLPPNLQRSLDDAADDAGPER